VCVLCNIYIIYWNSYAVNGNGNLVGVVGDGNGNLVGVVGGQGRGKRCLPAPGLLQSGRGVCACVVCVHGGECVRVCMYVCMYVRIFVSVCARACVVCVRGGERDSERVCTRMYVYLCLRACVGACVCVARVTISNSVGEQGVASLSFSHDGSFLAGTVCALSFALSRAPRPLISTLNPTP
jgi:hypothetical protein